ncbi:5995_t:CDS:2, partial [Funneliformis geosporum]
RRLKVKKKNEGVQYDKYYKPQEQHPRTNMIIDTLKTTQAQYMLQPTK